MTQHVVNCQESPPPIGPETNLELITGILHQAGDEIRTVTEADSLLPLVITVDADSDQWFIVHTVVDAMRPERRRVYFRADSVHEPYIDVAMRVLTLGVEYGGEHRNTGEGRVDVGRTIRADIRSLVVRHPSKNIVADRSFSRTYRDTIEESSIARMENTRVKCTQSANRRDSLLDKMLEPFFIIGATGLAVYLLFHVRS
jgi:hypothetical protein